MITESAAYVPQAGLIAEWGVSWKATPGEARHVLPKLANVLVCTDFSHTSRLALERAVKFCRRTGAHLNILHAVEYAPVEDGPTLIAETFPENALQDAQKKMDEILESLLSRDLSVNLVLRPGLPTYVIPDVIKELGIDLIFVGTFGTRRFERLVFGSTAEALLRQVSCPVVTVGPHTEVSHKREEIGPVVFATDFHEPAANAVLYAAAMAREIGSPLHCIHVLPLTMEVASRTPMVPQIMTEALKHLANEDCGIEPVCSIVYGSEVSHAIVDYARQQGAEMVVLGVRKASVLASHLPPQIAYKILVTAPCPVLTVSYAWSVEASLVAACV